MIVPMTSTEQTVATITTDAGDVHILLGRDADGGQYVRLDCADNVRLTGEEPGLYYPEPSE